MTTGALLPIGASSADLSWDAIDWQTAERCVRRLQMRIAKATQLRHRVGSPAFERLERCDGKLSRTVLRGGSDRKVTPLPCTIDSISAIAILKICLLRGVSQSAERRSGYGAG